MTDKQKLKILIYLNFFILISNLIIPYLEIIEKI